MSQTTQETNFPDYTAEEAESRETFLALMWALSYPGRIFDVPRRADNASGPDEIAVLAQVGHALLDLETTFYTSDPALAARLKLTAARAHPVERAAYHFYPNVSPRDLATIEQANVGTPQFPDQGATLFIGCTSWSLGEESSATHLTLSGPGIKGQQEVHFAGIPAELWSLRKRAPYPLGWDIYVVDPVGKVIGLPRSTNITLGSQE